MIDIKSAVKRAKGYLAEFFPEKIDSIRLEETELNEDGEFWNVTLSFLEDKDNLDIEGMPVKSQLATIFQTPIASNYRVYKLLKVRASDGEVMGMKIWKS
jgi:hypothetical protein